MYAQKMHRKKRGGGEICIRKSVVLWPAVKKLENLQRMIIDSSLTWKVNIRRKRKNKHRDEQP